MDRSYDVPAWGRYRCAVCGRFLSGTVIVIGAGPVGPDRCVEHWDVD